MKTKTRDENVSFDHQTILGINTNETEGIFQNFFSDRFYVSDFFFNVYINNFRIL
jgi:hypothetical protein